MSDELIIYDPLKELRELAELIDRVQAEERQGDNDAILESRTAGNDSTE